MASTMGTLTVGGLEHCSVGPMAEKKDYLMADMLALKTADYSVDIKAALSAAAMGKS